MSATLREWIDHELKFLRLNFRKEYQQYDIFCSLVAFMYNAAENENDFITGCNVDLRNFYEAEGAERGLFKQTIASHCSNYLKWYMRDVIKEDRHCIQRLYMYFGPTLKVRKGYHNLTPKETACRIAWQIWRQIRGKGRDWYETDRPERSG